MQQIGPIKTKYKVKPTISVKFKGHPRSTVPAELIPMLVINSQYDNKQRLPDKNSQVIEINCDEVIKKIRAPSDGNNILISGDNNKVVISTISLARALFLHNIHLTRTALRANGLQSMATASEGEDYSEIRFNNFSDFPLANLKSQSACLHLTWLLFDPHAKRSFNSIYASLQNSTSSNWHFDFNPPPLKGWKIKFAGYYDEDDNQLFHAHEIKGLHDPKFGYAKPVHIYHPKKKEPIAISPVNGKRPEIAAADPDPQLNLQAMSGIYRKKDVVTEHGFSFTFGGHMETSVMPGRPDKRVSPIVSNDKEAKSEQSAVGHGSGDGQAQELDWAMNRDDSSNPEVAQELNIVEATSQFLLFKQMIKRLMSLPEYKSIAIHCMELPKPNNGSQMYLNKNTGKPRTFHCAQFLYQGQPLMIVEVDMSDYGKSRRLSSRVFGFDGNAETKFRALMQSCSDSGVKWSEKEIKLHTCVSKMFKHPVEYVKVGEEKQRKTEEEYLTSWLNNIDKGIKSMHFTVL